MLSCQTADRYLIGTSPWVFCRHANPNKRIAVGTEGRLTGTAGIG